MSDSEVESCKESLSYGDYNNDGETSAIEMYQSHASTYANVFEGNEELSARAQEIALQQGEIYAAYAGDDGILDEYEYNAALQSEENSALLDQYWELKDYYKSTQGTYDSFNRYAQDEDGEVSPYEFLQNKLHNYKYIFGDNKESRNEAIINALKQTQILMEYAGEDGVLDQEEYTQALRSDEYAETMSDYLDISSTAF